MRHPLRTTATVAAAIGAVALAGCHVAHAAGGDGDSSPSASRTFALSGFTGVTLAGPDNVVVRRGDRFAVTASGPRDQLDRLDVKLDGSNLSIGRKHRDWGSWTGHWGGRRVTITVTLPALTKVTLAGSGDIDVDTIGGDQAEASVGGSGDIKFAAVNAGRLQLSIAGSGDISATGRAANVHASVVGSGNIDTPALSAAYADISVTGSGDVAMAVTGHAAISVIGSGDVTVTGGGACTKSKVGSGDITCS